MCAARQEDKIMSDEECKELDQVDQEEIKYGRR